MQEAVQSLSACTGAAVETLRKIVDNPSASDINKIAAARALLEFALRFSDSAGSAAVPTVARRLLPQTLRCCCFRLECSRSLSAAVGVCSTLEAASISTAAEMHSHIAGSAGPLKWLGLPNVCTWVRRWIFRPPERQRLKRTRQSSSPGRIGLALWRSRSGTTMPPRRRAEHPTIY